MDPAYALMDGYLEGVLTDTQFAELVDWLHADPENARAFAVWIQTHTQIADQVRKHDVMAVLAFEAFDPEEALEGDNDLPSLSTPEAATDWERLLAGSIYVEDNRQDGPDGSPSTREFFSLVGYVLVSVLTSKAAYKAYAAAAVVVLAVTLYVVFGGVGGRTAEQPLAGQEPGSSTQPVEEDGALPLLPASFVANLTAERNAVWDNQPGNQLFAGQRFTLTQGFAEITTSRGAVAILEAPATIELLDNDNAIRLHAGKLVGICETESSKGFLIRTAHLDVTDLGTRFGVDVTRAVSTEVHVLEGIIEVAKPHATAAGSALRLVTGESARAVESDLVIVRIEQDAARFAALLPYTVPLPGTGQGLKLGDTDPNWRVTAIDGKPLDPPGSMAVRDAHDEFEGPPFLPNDPQTSQWLVIDRQLGQLGQSGAGPVTFTCRGSFDLPPDIDLSGVRLVVSFDADNSATAVRLNGHRVAVPENEFEDGSRDLHTMTIRHHLIAGQNTIEFDVMDPRSPQEAVSGLRVKLSLQLDKWLTQE